MKETGIGISNPLFFIGVVENNIDKRLEGRVQVRAFSVHGTNEQIPTSELPWAICASGSYDPNTPPPPLNSFVYGMFLDGRDAQHPIVLGLIPSQMADIIDPTLNGWGVVPEQDGNIRAKGSAPEDVGNPQNSKLARGEYLEETYILEQEMSRYENAKIAGTKETYSEPNCAYRAEYPYNRVIETAKHSIELDDTPGAERIMIRAGNSDQTSSSFVQMDSSGTVVFKASGDSHTVTMNNEHVYVGGRSVVHIEGDSHVYVHGNKTEEVNGDYRLLVHGNAEFGVGGQLNLNASEQIQCRGADIKLDANVSTLTLRAKRTIHMGSSEGILAKTNIMNLTTTEKLDVFSAFDFNITSGRDFSVLASNVFQTATCLLPSISVTGVGTGMHFKSVVSPVNIESLSSINLNAAIVNADSIINLASGLALGADFASITIPCFDPDESVLPQPPIKSTALNKNRTYGSKSNIGVASAPPEIGF